MTPLRRDVSLMVAVALLSALAAIGVITAAQTLDPVPPLCTEVVR